MVATNDYVGKSDTELTFATGNVIFVPNVNDSSGGEKMYKGVYAGKVGFFPRIYVKDTTVVIEGGKTTRVKAAHAHEAPEGSEELSFPKDAVMFVVARASPQHWKGVWQGKAGLIPAEKVIDAADGPKAEEVKKLAGARCMATKTFVSSDEIDGPGGLTFKLGDIIFVPVPTPGAAEWQGVTGGVVGKFDSALVIDTATKSKEELEAIKTANAGDAEEQAAMEEYNEWKAARDAALGQ